MLDVVAFAEKLLAQAPSTTKVAEAPVLARAADGEHPHALSLRKIAQQVRLEGITVQHLDLDAVLSGAAQMKIASDEEAPVGAAVVRHPLAVELMKAASDLRAFVASERRAKIASMELELERAIVAEHEKRANDFSAAQNSQKTHGPGVGTMAAIGAGGIGAGMAAPAIASGDIDLNAAGDRIVSALQSPTPFAGVKPIVEGSVPFNANGHVFPDGSSTRFAFPVGTVPAGTTPALDHVPFESAMKPKIDPDDIQAQLQLLAQKGTPALHQGLDSLSSFGHQAYDRGSELLQHLLGGN